MWDFEALSAYEQDQRDFGVGTGMQDQVIGSVNDVPVERRYCGPNKTAPVVPEAGGSIGGRSGVATASGLAGVSDGAAATVLPIVTRDSSAPSSVPIVPAASGFGGDEGGGIFRAGNVAGHGNYFRLMNVRQFLSEAADEITERIINKSYDKLIGYVQRCLEQ